MTSMFPFGIFRVKMGEFLVHHVRFFEYKPQAIQCMAYNKHNKKLALSRYLYGNGSMQYKAMQVCIHKPSPVGFVFKLYYIDTFHVL